MTPLETIQAQIAEIRGEHVSGEGSKSREWCESCDYHWPCQTWKLAAQLEEAVKALEDYLVPDDKIPCQRDDCGREAREALSRIADQGKQ